MNVTATFSRSYPAHVRTEADPSSMPKRHHEGVLCFGIEARIEQWARHPLLDPRFSPKTQHSFMVPRTLNVHATAGFLALAQRRPRDGEGARESQKKRSEEGNIRAGIEPGSEACEPAVLTN